MSPLSYPHNRLVARIAVQSIDFLFMIGERLEVKMSNPSTVLGVMMVGMVREGLNSNDEDLEQEAGMAGRGEPGKVKGIWGSWEMRGVVRNYQSHPHLTQRILLGHNKFWGRGQNWVLDLAPLVDVYEQYNPNPNVFDEKEGWDEKKGWDEKWVRRAACGVNWRRDELGGWIAGVVEGVMGGCEERYTKVENKSLDVRIQVWFLRKKASGHGCPFSLGKEKVYLVIGLEGVRNNTKGIWCYWGGERVKVGCWSWGWGGDLIEKEKGEKRGRSRRRKGDVERGGEEEEEEDLRPLLL